MEDKIFSLETPESSEGQSYKHKILRIINSAEEKIRVIEPDALMNMEIHEKRVMDARAEKESFAKVRADVCEAFGVRNDPEHVFVFVPEGVPGPIKQRAMRAFVVLIDAVGREAFYGEGRTDHNFLLRSIVGQKMSKGDMSEEDLLDKVFDGISEKNPTYLFFKGFIGIGEQSFGNLTKESRKSIQTPVYDEEGKEIETPDNWFITGHNLHG
jgi:hypothetical protein